MITEQTRSRIVGRITALISYLIPRGSLKFNVAILGGTTALSQLVLIVFCPVLTRLYSTEDYGQLQVYLSSSLFFIAIGSLCYEKAILLPKDDETAVNLLTLSVILTIATSAILFVVFLSFPGLISPSLRQESYGICLPLTVCGAGLYQCFSSWSLRKGAYPNVAVTKLTQAVTNIGVQIALGVMHFGATGLLLGDVLGRSNGTFTLARLALKRDSESLSLISLSRMLSAGVRYIKFPLITMGSVLINTAGFALPVLLIADWYGSTIIGWFTLADRVTLLPASLIALSVSQVYSATAARLAHSDPQGLRRLFVRTVKTLFLIALPFSVLIAATGPILFAVVFGSAWREAGEYARIFACTGVVGFSIGPLMGTLNILERQSWQLGWDVLRMAMTCGSVFLAYQAGWSARAVVLSYALSLMLTYGVYMVIAYAAIVFHARMQTQTAT